MSQGSEGDQMMLDSYQKTMPRSTQVQDIKMDQYITNGITSQRIFISSNQCVITSYLLPVSLGACHKLALRKLFFNFFFLKKTTWPLHGAWCYVSLLLYETKRNNFFLILKSQSTSIFLSLSVGMFFILFV